MLRLFRNISPFSFFLLLIYFAGLSLHVWLFPEPADFTNLTALSDLLVNKWTGLSSLDQNSLMIIALSCIFLQGLIICFFMQYFKILNHFSLIPAVIFYLFCFLFDDFISFFILLPVNFLFIWFLFRLFTIYNKPQVNTSLFDLGILLSLSIALYFPAVAFILFALYTISKLRSTSMREAAIFFTACVMVFFLMATAFFWYDELPSFLHQFQLPQHMIKAAEVFSPVLLVKLFLSSILIIISLFFLNSRYSSVLIQIRKYFSCLIVYGIFAVASGALASPLTIKNIFPAMLPVSIITGYFFINMKNRDGAEILHIAFLGTVLLFQYINFAG